MTYKYWQIKLILHDTRTDVGTTYSAEKLYLKKNGICHVIASTNEYWL